MSELISYRLNHSRKQLHANIKKELHIKKVRKWKQKRKGSFPIYENRSLPIAGIYRFTLLFYKESQFSFYCGLLLRIFQNDVFANSYCDLPPDLPLTGNSSEKNQFYSLGVLYSFVRF
jgi:hypothetical protein